MAKDMHKKGFDECTKLKLKIFAECFRAWYPVFLNLPYIKNVYILDFFAGTGYDSLGEKGSPFILLDEAKGEDCKYCNQVKNNGKKVIFAFNEFVPKKQVLLKNNVESYIENCKNQNCKGWCSSIVNFGVYDFKDAFNKIEVQNILSNADYAKFILLDQYGYKHVDDDAFSKLISYPKTDFIFFISSSNIRRFKEHPHVLQYLDTNRMNFEGKKPHECHKIIADYYRSLIPKTKTYYVHHFTIKKGTNYWGLIFGSNHSFGMEKFLNVCWKHDKFSGEANIDMDGNDKPGELFFVENVDSKKIQKVKKELTELIMSGKINDNVAGLNFALRMGCIPSLYIDVINQLIKDKRVVVKGKMNKLATNIHNIKSEKIYNIETVQ